MKLVLIGTCLSHISWVISIYFDIPILISRSCYPAVQGNGNPPPPDSQHIEGSAMKGPSPCSLETHRNST